MAEGAPFDAVLVILADGARPDVMLRLASAGQMPHLQKHFIDAGGFRSATSVFPTVSGPAHLPVLTGAHPGRANLPGIRWARRPEGGAGRFLGRTRSYMAPFRSAKLARDIPADVQTLFQHVEGLADVNTWFVRGCPARNRRTRFSKAAAFTKAFVTTDWYASDLQAEAAVKGSWDAGFPSVFSVFPAIDELGHRFGPGTDASDEAYRRFDQALGRVVDDLVRRGRLERTLIAITSDHGQTDTHTHVDIDGVVGEIYPRTLAYPRLWRFGLAADAAVMVSGNAMANVYVRGSAGWNQRPDFDAPGPAADLLARLVADPAVAHVIHRHGAGRQYRVVGAEGALIVEAGGPEAGADAGAPLPQASWVSTRVDRGRDPLGLTGVGDRLGAEDLLARTIDGAYPDAPFQIAEFFRSPRAGDLVVCAKPGFDLRSRFEYQPHKGSHGCLDRAHMMVPAAVNARWQADHVRSVDLFPTILSALGRPVPAGLDGVARKLVRP